MDVLTHSATGLLLARAGCNRWTPLATPILVLASVFPDIDYASAVFGPAEYLHYRGGVTHSLAAILPLAVASVLLVWLGARRLAGKPVRWLPAVAAACVGLASHLVLDAVTSSGITLLAPFAVSRTHFDWADWVDFVIWAVLGLALAGPFLSRLVGQEITSGSLRQKWPGRGFPIFALIFLVVFLWGRSILHERALSQLDAWDYSGQSPIRLAALPDPVSPLRWRAIVETRDGFAAGDLNLARDFDPTRAIVYRKPELVPAIQAAADSAAFHSFLARARFPLLRVVPADEPEGASLVDVTDLAIGPPGASADRAEALVSERLQVLRAAIQLHKWRAY